MARWSNDFIRNLRNAEDGEGNYFPRFRLTIGTAAFAHGGDYPHFEDESSNVIVSTSHPERTVGADTWADWDPKNLFEMPEGLGPFSITAQSVQPRSWTYSAPQLTIEVTPDLARLIAKYAVPGALVEMDCNLNGEPGSMTFPTSFVSWSTIFLGQFRQMTYAGGKYTVTCRGFYEAAIGHPMVNRWAAIRGNDVESATDWTYGTAWHSFSDWSWFANVGNYERSTTAARVQLRDSWDGTNAGLSSPGATSGLIINRERGELIWRHGFAQRRTQNGQFDTWAYGGSAGTYNPFYGYGAAVIRPRDTTGEWLDKYWITYGDPDNFGDTQDLYVDMSTDTWVRNANDRSGHSRLGSYPGATYPGSEITSRVVVNGNPAIELATLLYSRTGWRCSWWTQARLFSDHVNVQSVRYACDMTKASSSGDALPPASPTNVVSTMCAVIEGPADNGKSVLDQLFAPLGIWPVFREGALGVGFCRAINRLATDMTGEPEGDVTLGYDGRTKVFNEHWIQSIDSIQMRAPGLDSTYQRVSYSPEGYVDEATAAVTTTFDVSDVRKFPGTFAATEPELGEFVFQAGRYNTLYPIPIANDFKYRCQPFLLETYSQIDLTLRGLRYAYLAPGDIVHVDIEGVGFDAAPLSSATSESDTQMGIYGTYPCMVISHQVDWMKGSVKVSVIKYVDNQRKT